MVGAGRHRFSSRLGAHDMDAVPDRLWKNGGRAHGGAGHRVSRTARTARASSRRVDVPAALASHASRSPCESSLGGTSSKGLACSRPCPRHRQQARARDRLALDQPSADPHRTLHTCSPAGVVAACGAHERHGRQHRATYASVTPAEPCAPRTESRSRSARRT